MPGSWQHREYVQSPFRVMVHGTGVVVNVAVIVAPDCT